MNEEVKVIADKVTVRGPQVDGGFAITFYVGQYEQAKIAKLLQIPQDENLIIRVKKYDELKDR